MNLYCAVVEFTTTWAVTPESTIQPERQRMTMLLAADDIFQAQREAGRIGEANAPMGPRLLDVSVRNVHSVALPARLQCHAQGVDREPGT